MWCWFYTFLVIILWIGGDKCKLMGHLDKAVIWQVCGLSLTNIYRSEWPYFHREVFQSKMKKYQITWEVSTDKSMLIGLEVRFFHAINIPWKSVLQTHDAPTPGGNKPGRLTGLEGLEGLSDCYVFVLVKAWWIMTDESSYLGTCVF